MNNYLTKEQTELIPDLIKLHKLAKELNIEIEAISTPRLRVGYNLDYSVELLDIDCYSSHLLYGHGKIN